MFGCLSVTPIFKKGCLFLIRYSKLHDTCVIKADILKCAFIPNTPYIRYFAKILSTNAFLSRISGFLYIYMLTLPYLKCTMQSTSNKCVKVFLKKVRPTSVPYWLSSREDRFLINIT
jgi:hypothetical protein